MRNCVLHVGAPKTGTTAIQAYLLRGLQDGRFQFIDLGDDQSAYGLVALCGSRPEDFWFFRWHRLDSAGVERLRQTYRRRLHRALRRAERTGATPIFSAESCWWFQLDELVRLRQLLEEQHLRPRVIVYLRSYQSWEESRFQQNVKWGSSRFFSCNERSEDGVPHYDYCSRLDRFANVFGAENLVVRPYAARRLVGGCAVRDFCGQIGLDLDHSPLPRANDGISLDALRCLYAYNKFARASDRPSVRATGAMIHHLQAMPGSKLRFDPTLLEPIAADLDAQIVQLNSRYGVDLSDPVSRLEAGDGLRSEADLFRFSPASLAWLAEAVAAPPLVGEGEVLARGVASQMVLLRQRALRLHWRPLLRQRLQLEWSRLLRQRGSA